MSLPAKLRKSSSRLLHESLIIGLLISTSPIIDGCSRGQEAAPAPSEQPSAEAPPPAAPESAPPAAQSPPAPGPPGEAAPAPGPPAAPPGAGGSPPGEAAAPPAPAPALATPRQLQELVSPIALYPDALVAQILAGSTFPTQVVAAERFVQQNPNLTGDALAAQVNPQPWDPSVRSLCQFPSVLQMMSQNVSWTTALGQAYYTQPQDVMTAIQVMRHRAMQAGTLKSTQQQRIVVETAPPSGEPVVVQEGGQPPQVIVIQPAQPNVVYVPSYNPSTVYGAPVAPPPGYTGTEMLLAGVAAGAVGFGAGMLVSSLINHGNNNWGTNWYSRNVVYNRNVYIPNSNYFAARYPGYRPGTGYPPYPGYRPGYPGYPANQPGYPANRPGYPPGYPAGYPPRPAPYAGNRANLAATNPNQKPIPKPGTYPNRPGVGNQPYPGRKPVPVGNVPGGGLGTTKLGAYPSGYKPGAPGKPAGNLAATKPYQPMKNPANNPMRGNPGAENRGGTHGSFGGSKHGGSSHAPGNSYKGGSGGRSLGAAGGGKGTGKTGGRPAHRKGG